MNPKVSFFLKWSFGVAAFLILAMLWDAADKLNDEIDRCSDDTSKAYIWNDAERAKACNQDTEHR